MCAAAHKCAARAVEVVRGRMSEINSFQWEVSMTFSTLIENIWFLKFSHGTLLPLYNNIIIWSLHCSYVIIFDDLFRLSLHGRSLSSLNRKDLFPQSRTTIIAQHRAYASVEVEPGSYTTLFLSLCQFYLISKTVFVPKFRCIWQKLGQRAILPPTGFLWLTHCKEVTADW